MKFLLLLFFLCSFFSRCLIAEETILPGKYTLNNSQEFIVVDKNIIKFHLYNEDKKAFIEKQYKYSLLTDGKIQPYPLASVEAIYGIGKYDWYFKDNNIHMKDPETVTLKVFVWREGTE